MVNNTQIRKQTVNEGTSKTIRVKNKISKFLPVINGLVSVRKGRAALKGKALISSGMKEVGLSETERKRS